MDMKKKAVLSYASPFPDDSTDNGYIWKKLKKEKRMPTSTDYNGSVGAFAIQPGGNIRPVGQTFRSSIDDEFEQQNEQSPATTEENMVTVPHATLVENEDEDFNTRLRKLLNGAMAVEVVQDNKEQSSIVQKSSKWNKKRFILVLLSIIVVTITLYFVTTQKGEISMTTSTPSIQPSAALMSTNSRTSFEAVSLFLKLGQDSDAVGFQLSCGVYSNDVIERRSAPAFVSKPGGIATAIYRGVPVDKDCTLEVTNNAGTGLQPNGFLRIHQGATISKDSTIFELSGNFTNMASKTFQVGLIASEVPSIAPTKNPSDLPSTLPSKMPSISSVPSVRPTLLPSKAPSTSTSPSALKSPPLGFISFPTNNGNLIIAPPSRPTLPIFPIINPSNPPRPTSLPSAIPSLAPTFVSYSIIVDIDLDSFPLETGWNLTCDDSSIASFPPGSYIDPKEEVKVSYDNMNYNAECIFIIVDTAEDGICCSNGLGRYRVKLLGDKNTTLFEHENSGNYSAQSQVEFQIR